jgi:hypothetical protein
MLAGLDPVHVLESLAPAHKDATWTLLLDATLTLLGVTRRLERRGLELVGQCDACGLQGFTVGRIKAWCSECGLEMDSREYLRLQIERHKASRPVVSP